MLPYTKWFIHTQQFYQWRHPLLHDQPPSRDDSVWKASRLSASSKAHITAMLSTHWSARGVFLKVVMPKESIKLKTKKALNCVGSIKY